MTEFSFKVTDSAAKRISDLISQEKDSDVRFRLTVNGGGCSGFKYDFSFDKAKNDNDIVISKGNAQVIIDELSLGFLNNSELDFQEDLGGASFVVKNPNATAKCGCGSSFSV